MYLETGSMCGVCPHPPAWGNYKPNTPAACNDYIMTRVHTSLTVITLFIQCCLCLEKRAHTLHIDRQAEGSPQSAQTPDRRAQSPSRLRAPAPRPPRFETALSYVLCREPGPGVSQKRLMKPALSRPFLRVGIFLRPNNVRIGHH